jgi:hypothetical protein
MNKAEIMKGIIARLSLDLDVPYTAAKIAHRAATHPEGHPDDTLALEASYVAQRQADRAQVDTKSIEIYKQLKVQGIDNDTIRLTYWYAEGTTNLVFTGPLKGGFKIEHHGEEIMVITPGSLMGRELLGKCVSDSVDIEAGTGRMEYDIVEVC